MRISHQKIFSAGINFLITVLLQPGNVLAQTSSPHFIHLTDKNGLSSNRVKNIIQDSQGFYWIATIDGLNRFDGSNFRIFQHNKNDSTSISNNTCNSVLEGNDGDIWVATQQGVCRYQKKKGTFKNYFFNHPLINENLLNAIYGLSIDEKGNIWATSKGLWRINPVNDSITGFINILNEKGSVPSETGMFNVSFDRMNKGLWMYTDLELVFFDIKTETFYNPLNNPFQWPVFQLKDKKALFAIGPDYLWLYDKESELLYRFVNKFTFDSSVHISFPHAISNFSVDGEGNPLFSFELVPALLYNWQQQKVEKLPGPDFSSGINFSGVAHLIYNDHNNNKWLSTAEGIYVIRHDANLLKFFMLGRDKSGFKNTIYSFVKHRNSLWLEIREKLFRFDLDQQNLFPIESFEGGSAKVLYNAGDSLLWISRKNEILLFEFSSLRVVSRTLLESNPYFVIEDKKKHYWVGTWDGGLYEMDDKGRIIMHYVDKNGLTSNFLICGWYDGADELWLGMNGGHGFSKLDLKTRKFESFVISGKKPAAEFNTITAIISDKSRNLWLGTYGGGVYYFDRQQNQFQNYQRSDGLSGDNINSLAFDSTGNLWISTANGIDIIDVKTKGILHVNELMQQVNNDHISNLAIGDDGTFYYAADNRILAVNPGHYIIASDEAKILISGFRIFDKEIPYSEKDLPVKLSYRQNFFSIEFSALKVSPEIPARYKYKLEGFNDGWIYGDNRGFANFTNVPPGNYTLLLNATNETGKWNNMPVEMTLIIEPPFWETWWFFILSALLAGSVILYIVESRVRQFKRRQHEQLRLIVATQEKEKKSIAAELHDDLGVRLSALKYFITSLKKYLSPGNAQAQVIFDKTIATIDESVEDVRYLLINLSPKTLNEYGYLVAVEDLVNKLSHLHIINISLTQKNMEKRLHPDIEAGLYRITQELINNTMKHANAGSIQLTIERTSGAILLHYADDGKGFDPIINTGGYGIENINTRVALLNGKIEWNAEVNRAAEVVISVPYYHT